MNKNLWRYRKKINIQKLVCYVCVIAIYLINIPSAMQTNNLVYGVGEINKYNSSYFAGNIFLPSGNFSPRYIVEYIFSFFMRFMKWELIAVGFIILGILAISLSIVMIGYKVSEEYGLIVAIYFAFFLMLGAENTLGGSSIYLNSSDIGTTLGKGLGMIGIAFVIGKRKSFLPAWIFTALASCMHIHEGVYAFGFVAIVFIIQCICDKKVDRKSLKYSVIPIVVILMSVIPAMLGDSMSLSNTEFIDIYAYQRNGHHLIPSVWGNKDITLAFLQLLLPFIIAYICFFKKSNKKEKINYYIASSFFLGTWLMVMIFTYVGTEVLNIPLIATLFLPKMLKYINIMVMILYAVCAVEYWKNHRYSESIIIICFSLIVHIIGWSIIIYFFTLCVFLSFDYEKAIAIKKNRMVTAVTVVCSLGVLILKEIIVSKYVYVIVLSVIVCIVCMSPVDKYTKQRNAVSLIIGILLLCISLKGKLYIVDDTGIEFVTSTDYMIKSCGIDVYELARQFEEISSADEMFIADSSDVKAGWLQLISKRNCYVTYKGIPCAKSKMKEWFDRYQLTNKLLDKDIAEITNIMDAEKIDIILVKEDAYGKFDTSDGYMIFLGAPNDEYRLYKKLEK